MYAILQTSGRQYKTAEGDKILVSGFLGEANQSIDFDQVLLVAAGKKITLGQPYIKNAKVKGKILEHLKGKKLHIAKFRAKTRYRRKTGFRPQLTKILIEKISLPRTPLSKSD